VKSRTLYIISATYPFGKGEEFVKKELAELSKRFSEIYLFPLRGEGEKRWLPENVKLNISLTNVSRGVSFLDFLKYSFLLLNIFFVEFLRSDKRWYFLTHLRTHANSIIQSSNLAAVFLKATGPLKDDDLFYSVWMDDGALVLSILHWRKRLKRFVFRLHGYDLFDERRPGSYMPFRCFNFKHAHKIFILSQAGYDYLFEKKLYRNKLLVNYSGLYEQGDNPFDPFSKFTIVSCSNVIAIKRIDKIIDSLRLLEFPLKWIHFGDGEKMSEIRNMASLLPGNVEWELKGHIRNDELIAFYRTNPVNLFLHLSDTEGLGMAIVEAQSFGIPAIATNVGGVSEVVNDLTGILVSPAEKPEKIAAEINKFKSGVHNTIGFRSQVKKAWKGKFSAEKNYQYFYEKLIE
jgi:glycosyltransferase involved in cell wall biosynthesis